ncbi:29478_t:CDS:2, partial [Gigaspora margarita]
GPIITIQAKIELTEEVLDVGTITPAQKALEKPGWKKQSNSREYSMKG